MEPNQRFSILTFPQLFDGTDLHLNIVVLPRDHNPLNPAIVPDLAGSPAPSFAKATLAFTANVFDNLSTFPNNMPTTPNISLTTTSPTNAEEIFKALAKHFDIVNTGVVNSNIILDGISNEYKPESARPEELTIRKYLPRTYRNAFNFTNPRTRNAVVDDSYHCAVKDGKNVPGFQSSSDTVSWGKVYAYLMRQPVLAAQAGMIYKTKLINASTHFANGGWLFVDLSSSSDFHDEQSADGSFIKRYAARIPTLTATESRQVFAPILFPVTDSPAGNYDDLFKEAAEYDDGFAKIVHCHQPANRDFLVEESDGTYPTKDVGIQLGWDDEQILIWYMRQLMIDTSVGTTERLDAPLGVFGYSIDVREVSTPENNWESLNSVKSKSVLTLAKNPLSPGDNIKLDIFSGELPYQVYPIQIDGRKTSNYWLPMYFGGWNGGSMVLTDGNALKIYQHENSIANNDTGVKASTNNQLNAMYSASNISTLLRYGTNYEFRMRLQDLSGGSAPVESYPINETASDIGLCRFKRFISPNQPRVRELDTFVNSDEPITPVELNMKRPKLGYPAVVYTGKYTDPVKRLTQQSELGTTIDAADFSVNAEHREGLGIADPDVDRFEIVVEIESLKLDKLDSVSGKEDYVHLYTTFRTFPNVSSDNDYETALNIPISYIDVEVLHTGDKIDITTDLELGDDIDNLPGIVLPTARGVRLTLRAVCENKADNDAYYGVIDTSSKLLDNRYGEPLEIKLYKESVAEKGLLNNIAHVPDLLGIFMQSDIIHAFNGRFSTFLIGNQSNAKLSNIQLLADALDVESSGLTLNGAKGERIVFGCSSRIRHSLAPDGSSITFASKGDLINHWLCCLSFDINRDWMWDGLKRTSFEVRRTMRFTGDAADQSTDALVGKIEMTRTASFESLDDPQRNSSRIVFIDAVEPKKPKPGNGDDPGFPDAIELEYELKTLFKDGHAAESDDPAALKISLPITSPPSQVPKITSAGIALSPYVRNAGYSSTESRQRHLWIEFEEAIQDPNDTYFARVLATAPDQLLSNNNPQLFAAPQEPALPIDPEQIRTFEFGATNDLSGLNAMQVMEKSTTSDRHYLLPLPPALHANSDEMFGFFTYEFRIGHYEKPPVGEQDPEKVWTTAQGRYGRQLRATGIQHPAPTLTCMPNRDEDKLWVTAPYAVVVHDGKNVTADPPRTQLWALLYAQVKQADNLDHRNILLDDRPLDWRIKVAPKKETKIVEAYTDEELDVLNTFILKNYKYDLNIAEIKGSLTLVDSSAGNKNATKYGTGVWSQSEIAQLLNHLCLPDSSSLSVLVVEILPQITNISDHISGLENVKTAQAAEKFIPTKQLDKYWQFVDNANQLKSQKAKLKMPSPLSDELGHHRILRTSPLTEVPDICCPDC